MTAALDRESACNKEIQSLHQQLSASEKARQELSQQIVEVTEQRDNKHEQLASVIQINHRLSAQLRFLVARLLEYDPTYINISDTSSINTHAADVSTRPKSTSVEEDAPVSDVEECTDGETRYVPDTTLQLDGGLVSSNCKSTPFQTEMEEQLLVSETSLRVSCVYATWLSSICCLPRELAYACFCVWFVVVIEQFLNLQLLWSTVSICS